MDFELSADQQELRAAAADLLDDLASSERVRASSGPGPGLDGPGPGTSDGFDRALWAAMADQGWMAVERPEGEGGLGLGLVEVAVLCEELGRRTAPVPYLETVCCRPGTRVRRMPWWGPRVLGDELAAEWWAAGLGGCRGLCRLVGGGRGTVGPRGRRTLAA